MCRFHVQVRAYICNQLQLLNILASISYSHLHFFLDPAVTELIEATNNDHNFLPFLVVLLHQLRPFLL